MAHEKKPEKPIEKAPAKGDPKKPGKKKPVRGNIGRLLRESMG